MLPINYIYLKIPTSWKLVYDKLLVKMANLGEDLLKECNASCTGENREYIACWNMFQAACAAFEIGEYSKANTLISFICAKLEISLIDQDSTKFKRNLVIIPAYTSKGLEFDSVIIYNDRNNSYKKNERNLLYVACTRCQHELIIYN